MLWMAVSPDSLELPLAVENTALNLARKMHTTKSNILSKKCRREDGKRCGYKVVTVDSE